MSELEMLGRLNELERRLRRQEAKSTGPTLGEVYAQFLGVPGLRAFWPMSSFDSNLNAVDISGQGRGLVNTVGVSMGIYNNLIPYTDYSGTTYHARPDEADLDFDNVDRMLCWGWFWLDNLPAGANTSELIYKWGDATQSAYRLSVNSSGVPTFSTWDGASVDSVSGGALSTGAWHFIVGRFLAGTSIDIWVDGTKTPNTTGINATIQNGTANLSIGSGNGVAGTFLDGRAAMVGLAGIFVWPDELIDYWWQRSRVLFGA